jgi:cbb3-type cytochrome oxidase subunit 3
MFIYIYIHVYIHIYRARKRAREEDAEKKIKEDDSRKSAKIKDTSSPAPRGGVDAKDPKSADKNGTAKEGKGFFYVFFNTSSPAPRGGVDAKDRRQKRPGPRRVRIACVCVCVCVCVCAYTGRKDHAKNEERIEAERRQRDLFFSGICFFQFDLI